MKYKHKNSGGIYIILFKSLTKIDGKWLPSITYQADGGILIFNRLEEDFNEKFDKVGWVDISYPSEVTTYKCEECNVEHTNPMHAQMCCR